MKKLTKIFAAIAATMALALVPSAVFAQASDTTDVTQVINGGTLSAQILDASRVAVTSPTFAMTATNFSFACQTTTGTIGSDSQRLYIINPSDVSTGSGWNLNFAATGPWASGGNNYAYNDAAGSGCTNGQLTVNPTAGTLTNDCTSTACTGATVTKGSSTAMTSTTPVNLLTTSSTATVYRGYLTGVTLSQAIPAEKPAGTYTLPATITAVAI